MTRYEILKPIRHTTNAIDYPYYYLNYQWNNSRLFKYDGSRIDPYRVDGNTLEIGDKVTYDGKDYQLMEKVSIKHNSVDLAKGVNKNDFIECMYKYDDGYHLNEYYYKIAKEDIKYTNNYLYGFDKFLKAPTYEELMSLEAHTIDDYTFQLHEEDDGDHQVSLFLEITNSDDELVIDALFGTYNTTFNNITFEKVGNGHIDEQSFCIYNGEAFDEAGGIYYTSSTYKFPIDELTMDKISSMEQVGFLELSTANTQRPFDDKTYTKTFKDDELIFEATYDKGYEFICLTGIRGERLKIETPIDTYEFDLHKSMDGETIGFKEINPDGGAIKVTIQYYNHECTLGGFYVGANGKYIGLTDYKIDFTLNDYSPMETKAGGYIDYLDGIALYKADLQIYNTVGNLKDMLIWIKDTKKKMMIYDLAEESNDIPIIVGRANNIRVGTNKKENYLNNIVSGSFSIEEAS